MDLNIVPGLSAVTLCCIAAGLCPVQNFVGVTALARRLFVACVTEQHLCSGLECGSRLVSVLLVARLCQVQGFIGITALARRLFVACLTEQHWCRGHQHASRLECCQCMLKCSRTVSKAKLHRCNCTGKKAVFSVPHTAALVCRT